MASPPASADKMFGLYIHWPFCQAKCPYCDFNSHVHHGALDQSVFVEAFEKELAHFKAMAPPKAFTSIFFGGGTPSLMEAKTVEALLNVAEKKFGFAPNIEISLEANPTSVDAERFHAYGTLGVNRVSLGVQALQDEALQQLGRLHCAKEAMEAVALAQSIFPRSSFDLIYARPHQSLKSWEQELTRALDMAVGHVSLYQLVIEKGTRYFDLFHKGKIDMPTPELAADMFDLTQQLCRARNYEAYEISNHAQPGDYCLHNLNYWLYGDYIGIGPGAHSRLHINGERYALEIEKDPKSWIGLVAQQGHGVVVRDILTWQEQADEFLLMGLRTKWGIDPKNYEAIARVPLDDKQIGHLVELNMIEQTHEGFLRVTPQGWPVLDAVVADLAA